MSGNQIDPKAPQQEDFPAGFYFNLVSFVASCATLFMVYVQLNEFKDARVTSSFTLLNSPMGGNSAKGKHLEYLYENGYNIVDMDVSCKGPTLLASDECSDPQIVSEFDLRRLAEAAPRAPVQLKADGAWFVGCSLKNQGFVLKGNYASFGCNMHGAVLEIRGVENTLYLSEFQDSQIQAGGSLALQMVNAEKSSLITGMFTRAEKVPVFMDGGSFTDGKIWLEQFNLRIRNTNISGTMLTGLNAGVIVDDISALQVDDIALVSTSIKETLNIQTAWYWDDNPPLIDLGVDVPLTEIPTEMVVCPSKERDNRAGFRYTPAFSVDPLQRERTVLKLRETAPNRFVTEKFIMCEFASEYWMKYKRDVAVRR